MIIVKLYINYLIYIVKLCFRRVLIFNEQHEFNIHGVKTFID